jgi:hypothetical protein
MEMERFCETLGFSGEYLETQEMKPFSFLADVWKCFEETDGPEFLDFMKKDNKIIENIRFLLK